jgi:hypothetical protein
MPHTHTIYPNKKNFYNKKKKTTNAGEDWGEGTLVGM